MALTKLNFANRSAPLSGWRLALLAAGLLALGAAGLDWMAQLRGVSKLEADLAQARPRSAEHATLPADEQREQDRQRKIIGAAVRQLNVPVTRLIRTVQAPRDIRVALLGLDLNGAPEPGDAAMGASGALKISAEAETARDMMNYVAFLNEQALFSSVYLVKHELHAAAPGHPYRFQLEAQWRE